MEIVVTAMTKMQNGVCFAGINPITNEWVRPVWSFRQWQNINYLGQNRLVNLGDVIKLSNPTPRPSPPHVEDVEVSGFRFVRKMEPNEFRAFLQRNIDHKAVDDIVFRAGNRSLCLLQPTDFIAYAGLKDALSTRMSFQVNDEWYRNDTQVQGFPCTDLRWRANRREHAYDLDIREFDAVYLAMGLTRVFSATGKTHPMVISVITFPSFEFRLDPESL